MYDHTNVDGKTGCRGRKGILLLLYGVRKNVNVKETNKNYHRHMQKYE